MVRTIYQQLSPAEVHGQLVGDNSYAVLDLLHWSLREPVTLIATRFYTY